MQSTFAFTPGFNPGAIRDRIDPRDYQWSEIGSALAPFNWQQGFDVETQAATALNQPGFTLPNKNQYTSFSCGGQAWGNYGGAMTAVATGSFAERSAKFIYSQTYEQGGGSAGRDNCNIVINQGWGKESLTSSYDTPTSCTEAFMERPQDITDVARQQAKLATALSYANVALDIDSMAQAAAANNGMVIGLTGSNDGTWLSAMPIPPAAGTVGTALWQHWLYVGKAAMYNGKKALGIFNSWGPSVGINGWQWITEDYFAGMGGQAVWSGWTHLYSTTPVPATFAHDFQVNMVYGESSIEIQALQTALQVTGDFPASIAPTQYFGNITAAAVLKFQIRNNIAPANSHSAGPKTRAALNVLFNK